MPMYRVEALFYHQEDVADKVEQAVRAALADLGIYSTEVVSFWVGCRDS